MPEKPISHLQQGISKLDYNDAGVVIYETPFLFPNPKVSDRLELKDYFGPITGVLVNCYDPNTKNLLFHIRGKDVDSPFGFQAAAAGMGRFRENPWITAKKELEEEAGILYPSLLFQGKAIDALPFMKGSVPQPLFSFGFSNDLSGFPVCNNLEDIAKFEDIKKIELKETKKKPEAYHFTIPYNKVEKISGELNDKKRFFGPIYDSTINFIKALKDSKKLRF